MSRVGILLSISLPSGPYGWMWVVAQGLTINLSTVVPCLKLDHSTALKDGLVMTVSSALRTEPSVIYGCGGRLVRNTRTVQ